MSSSSSSSSSCSSLLLLLLLLFLGPRLLWAQDGGEGAAQPRNLWCVATNNAEDAALQAAINWACGPGGANCGPIQQGGPCYDGNDLQRTASWAFNDYYLKNGMTDDACNFSNTAALTSLNPSHDNCRFPSSLSVSNRSVPGSTTTIDMGPASADISSSSQIAGTWLWPLLSSHLFAALTMVMI